MCEAHSNWRQKRIGNDARMPFSLIYFFAPISIFYIPHNYVIPQAMPHAIPQTHSAFYPHRVKMCGEKGFIAVRETVHLVKFMGKGCSIFFSSAYVTLLSTTGYKVLKNCFRIHMVYLASQQQNKLIQFPVCANIGVLFTLDILSQACEKHMQTRFSL